MMRLPRGRKVLVIWGFYLPAANGRKKRRKLCARRTPICNFKSRQRFLSNTQLRGKSERPIPKRLRVPFYPLAFGGTYPSGSFESQQKKNCSSCSSMIFCEFGSRGFRRYSFMIILECSIQSFQPSFDTFS